MALKNQLTKADFVPMDKMNDVINRLAEDKQYRWSLYFMFSTASVLRVVDVLSTKWEDIIHLEGKKACINKIFSKKEKKTGKRRRINFSESVADVILDRYKDLGEPKLDSYMFCNKSGAPLSTQYINRTLKQIRDKYDLDVENFSTHSFRKTFAREFWEKNSRSNESLMMLMQLLNHSSLAMTSIYLGVTGEAVAEVYDSYTI